MARHEQDRENLLREATALVERAEVKIASHEESIVVGFRRDGSLSIFFGADPVYQFNTSKQLRRAFVAGLLYRAERGKLVALRRVHDQNATTLLRHDATAEEQTALLEELSRACQEFHARLVCGDFSLVGEVPPQANVVARAEQWLQTLPMPIEIAQRPNVG